MRYGAETAGKSEETEAKGLAGLGFCGGLAVGERGSVHIFSASCINWRKSCDAASHCGPVGFWIALQKQLQHGSENLPPPGQHVHMLNSRAPIAPDLVLRLGAFPISSPGY